MNTVAEKGTMQHNSKYTEMAGEDDCKRFNGLNGCKHEVFELQK